MAGHNNSTFTCLSPLTTYLSLGCCCCDETWCPKHLGEKGFIRLTMEEVRIRTLAGLKPGGWSYCKDHEGVLFIGLLSTLCSAFFFIEPWTTGPSFTPATMGWILPQRSLRKCPVAGLMGTFSQLRVPLWNDSSLSSWHKLASMLAPIKFFLIYLHVCLYCALENQRGVGSLGAWFTYSCEPL